MSTNVPEQLSPNDHDTFEVAKSRTVAPTHSPDRNDVSAERAAAAAEQRTDRHDGEPMPGDVATALAEAGRASRRRRWPAFLLGGALGAAAAWGTVTYLDGRQDDEVAAAQEVELATAEVEQRDLLEEVEWAATLGYGEAVDVAGVGGVVTSATAIGSILERGDVMATVDDQPIVVFFGETPMWRDLGEGVEGPDVLQLETNLAALGYDPDQTVDIDNEFTANTALIVARWQEELGVESTGEVALGAVAVVAGPSSVVSIADVGSTAGAGLASVAPQRSVTDVVASLDGLISALAPVGEPLTHGTVLYSVDETPVVAVIDADAVASVLVSETFTDLELEAALEAGGYDPDAEMTVDGVLTEATAAAIERWQTDAGFPVTGVATPGHYVLLPVGRAVDAQLVGDGDSVNDGGPILLASTSELSVEMVVDVGDTDEFEVGQTVSIEMADETVVDGTVADIGAAVRAADPQGTPTVTITIDVTAGADQVLIEGPVTVLSIGEAIEGATVVPTRALVTLAEGGFAVEKVNDDGSATLVGVELGSFDDGVVEVVEGDVRPGDEVVVPK